MNDLERQLLDVLGDVQALRQTNDPWAASCYSNGVVHVNRLLAMSI